MDYQTIVDGMSAMTCVVSVEVLEDGSRGKFRIVTGNKAYIDSIEHPAPGTEMLKDKFVPNTEYTDYLYFRCREKVPACLCPSGQDGCLVQHDVPAYRGERRQPELLPVYHGDQF